MSSSEIKSFSAGASSSRAASTGAAVAEKRLNRSDCSEISATFSDRFEILKSAAASGSAVCYLAEDLNATPLNALVKLKVFSGQSAGDLEELELFKVEAQAAAKLLHRNILKASLPEESDGIHFAVLEHRAGAETLSDLLDREAWLDLKLAAGIILQITDALDYAHRAGVLHLALHPDNISIDRDGTALVADFGIPANSEYGWAHEMRARRHDAQYISPEQASGEPVDARSDLYALGLLMHKMLTDRLPFDGENADTIKQKQINQSPMPPHLFCENVPLWMSGLITCLLEKNPAKRFQSAGEFRASLNELAISRLGLVIPHPDLSPPPVAEAQENTEAIAEAAPAAAEVEPASIIERELWEPPTITVIDPPLEQLSTFELLPDTKIAEASSQYRDDEYVEPDPMAIEHSTRPIAVDGGARVQWLRLALIVGLAIVVAGGLLALARPNTNDAPQKQVPVELPAAEIRTDDPTGAADSRPEGSTTTAEPPAADKQIESVPPETSKATVSKRQPKSVRRSVSRRSRTAKQKPRRVRQFRR